MVVALGVMLTEGMIVVETSIIIEFEPAVWDVTQLKLELNSQIITSLLTNALVM
jgi:hypothetical protein